MLIFVCGMLCVSCNCLNGSHSPSVGEAQLNLLTARGVYRNTPNTTIAINPDVAFSGVPADVGCYLSCDQADFTYGAYDTVSGTCCA